MAGLSEVAAQNQLKINIAVITLAQSWINQIAGVYSFLYPLATEDFVHLKDFEVWRTQYDLHIHNNGNNGSPVTPPAVPIQWNQEAIAKAMIAINSSVGQLKSTVIQANILATSITSSLIAQESERKSDEAASNA